MSDKVEVKNRVIRFKSKSCNDGFRCIHCGAEFRFTDESNHLERIESMIVHASVCDKNPLVQLVQMLDARHRADTEAIERLENELVQARKPKQKGKK